MSQAQEILRVYLKYHDFKNTGILFHFHKDVWEIGFTFSDLLSVVMMRPRNLALF